MKIPTFLRLRGAALACLALLSCAVPTLFGADWISYEPKPGPGAGKHVVFLAGDEEYRSEEGLPLLAKILSQRHGFKTTVLFSVNPDGTINPDAGGSLSGSEALDSADAIVMLLRFRHWPEEATRRFENAVNRGVPIIALRTSTHAFNGYPKGSPWEDWNYNRNGGFGKKVLGETWVTHWGDHKKEATRGVVEPSTKDLAILRGVEDVFADSDVYEAYPPSDATILKRGLVLTGMKPTDPPATRSKKRATDRVEQPVNDPAMAVAWTRENKNAGPKNNRIFTTTMGAATDLQSEGLRRLVVNAVFWGLGLEVPAKADVAYVDGYNPTFYGFGSYRKGVKPDDLALGKPIGAVAEVKTEDLLKPQPRGTRPALPANKLPLEFLKGERIAFVGGGQAERMNLFGHFETLLHSRFPEKQLVVRNFGRPGDEVGNRQRPNDYTKLDDPLQAFGADTFLCFFGFNESFEGPGGVAKFKSDYEKFLDEYAAKYPRDDRGAKPRFVIVSPTAAEATGDKFLPDATAQNANLKLYAAAAGEVAAKRGLVFVDVFNASQALFAAQPGAQFTVNGVHLNEAGDRVVGELMDRAFFGPENPGKAGSAGYEKLRAAVNDKSWIHLQDYRMLNGWYVYGGRRTFDTETFPREFVKIRNMAAVRDRYVWDLAAGKSVAAKPDDSDTGELFVPPTRFGEPRQDYSEPESLRYASGEEAISRMTPAPGFEVKLFADEQMFPELAKPDQIAFDNKGRLWVSCMPSYPMWKPGDPRPNDRLLIFEDTDKDGRADKCTTFYDKLICPTGFEFWNGGVLVVDEPRMLFLKDTDGDDKADLVVHLSDGWATEDTHHTIGAFEWSHGGLLHMMEGVSLSTSVETPWGPMRNRNSSGVYQLDPLTQKLKHFVTPGYGNPWCYVFDWWGQGISGDGTMARHHWDSPLSGAPYRGRGGMNPIFDNQGMRPAVGSEFLYSRHFPAEMQGQFIYACVINMNGIPRFQFRDDGSGFTGERVMTDRKDDKGKLIPDDLLRSTDMNFRPVDPQIGPDGALWFGDWCNALIGHMQYSQRDPNRDKTRGRVYRLYRKDTPLLEPTLQFGKSESELLDQLKIYETRTRYRARRELADRPTAKVAAAIQKWVAALDPSDKEYDRLLCEALWVQQRHHAVDTGLLKKVLAAKSFQARAAAVHVASDEQDFLPGMVGLISPLAKDPHPRVRLEVVRALSYVPTEDSVRTALGVLAGPTDTALSYTVEATLGALMPLWEEKVVALTENNPAGREFLEGYLAKAKPGEVAGRHIRTLLSDQKSEKVREDSYRALERMKGSARNGKEVFGRMCTSCHKVGDAGIVFGPDLTKVAGRLNAHDLMESIIDPNAKMDPAFQSTNIETKGGDAFTGFVTEETPDSLKLRIAGGIEQVFKKSDLSSREQVRQSSMPEGLAAAMSPTEFLDLIDYLKTLR